MIDASNILPTLHFNPGDIIFHEGDTTDGAYLICEGSVEISIMQQDKKVVLAVYGMNDIFGSVSMIAEKPHSTQAKALTSTWCYVINRHHLEQKLHDMDPILHKIVTEMGEQLINHNERLKQDRVTQETL